MVEERGAFLEELAFVDRFAVTVTAEFEELLDGGRAVDELVDLGKFA